MKRIAIDQVRPPLDLASPVTRDHFYTVVLGNHWRVSFTSDRHAQAFAAETERMLNAQLFTVNLLLVDAFTAYRMAWPLFAHNRAEGHAKMLRDGDAAARGHVLAAWDAIDRAITHTGGENGPFRAWQFVSAAAEHVRKLGLELASLYRLKSHGVERARMDVLVARCNDVLLTLKDYGREVPTAVSTSPSPYG